MNLEILFRKKPWLLILLGLVIVLAMLSLSLPFTIFSVSKVEIDPQGYIDPATNEWKGSFWIVTMTADVADQVAGIKLINPTGEPGNTYIETDDGTKAYADDTLATGERVVPQSTITIKIDPLKPYWERPLEIQSGQYASEAWGGWVNVAQYGRTTESSTALPYVHKKWGTGSWTQHTPFEVSVLKNDIPIGPAVTIDTIGGTEVRRIPETGEEHIYLTNLGKLQTGYGEPQLGEILYFSSDYIFRADTTSENYIKYDAGQSPAYDAEQWGSPYTVYGVDAYSVYWYGYGRWEQDSTPAPYTHSGLVDGSTIGGWNTVQVDAFTWRDDPITPVVFPGDKTPEMGNFMSLMEWLDSKSVSRVAMPQWLDSLEITENDWMRLYMPYGAASSLITLKISTELADTIVWQPQVANFDITAFPDLGDISDRKTSSITVTCLEGAGSGTITFNTNPENLPISLDPPVIGTGSMSAGDVKTFNYEILNLGIADDTAGTITGTIKNSLGTTTDTATASFTLLQKTGSETILTVKTIYQGDKSPITGIVINIEYAEQSKSGLTDTSGQGVITFSLGSYSGDVRITSASTATYRPKELTVQVTAGKQTTIILELYKFSENPFDWTQFLPWVLLIGVTVPVVFFMYKKRRKLF